MRSHSSRGSVAASSSTGREYRLFRPYSPLADIRAAAKPRLMCYRIRKPQVLEGEFRNSDLQGPYRRGVFGPATTDGSGGDSFRDKRVVVRLEAAVAIAEDRSNRSRHQYWRASFVVID